MKWKKQIEGQFCAQSAINSTIFWKTFMWGLHNPLWFICLDSARRHFDERQSQQKCFINPKRPFTFTSQLGSNEAGVHQEVPETPTHVCAALPSSDVSTQRGRDLSYYEGEGLKLSFQPRPWYVWMLKPICFFLSLYQDRMWGMSMFCVETNLKRQMFCQISIPRIVLHKTF